MLNKKIILIPLLFILFYSYSNGQAIQYILASEGLELAKTTAINNGTTNPELIMIITLTQTVTMPVIGDVTFKFKVDDGKANGWIYLFRSADNHSNITAIAVAKVLVIGFQAAPIPADNILNALQIDVEQTLESIEWVDSDSAAAALRNNEDFYDYYSKHKNPITLIFGLLMNTKYDFLTNNHAFWVISSIDKRASKLCGVEAVTKEVYCTPTTDVEEFKNQNAYSVFPNPTNDFIYLKLKDFALDNSKIKLYNVFGGEILFSYSIENQELIKLDINELSSGSYFITINAEGRMITLPFVKY